MSHADHESASTFLNSRVNAEFEAWDERFTAFETKSLHCVELASHKGAPLMSIVKAGVHMNALSLSWLSELD